MPWYSAIEQQLHYDSLSFEEEVVEEDVSDKKVSDEDLKNYAAPD